jgi:formamidopyrimidine-DNA glycosylase
MIHPNTKWNKLTSLEKKLICINTRKSMRKSYQHGGAQIRDFKNPDMQSSLKLDVYNKTRTKKGLVIIKQRTADNRISYWCPDIQKIQN